MTTRYHSLCLGGPWDGGWVEHENPYFLVAQYPEPPPLLEPCDPREIYNPLMDTVRYVVQPVVGPKGQYTLLVHGDEDPIKMLMEGYRQPPSEVE